MTEKKRAKWIAKIVEARKKVKEAEYKLICTDCGSCAETFARHNYNFHVKVLNNLKNQLWVLENF